MFYDLFAHAFVHQDYGVYPVIGRRLQCSHDIRRHILAEAATGLRHRPGSDTTSLAHQHVTSENHIIFNHAVAGNLAPVSEHTVITDMRVVGNMHAFMQEIAITDNRLPARIGRTVDHYVFTDHIVISDFDDRIISLIVKILRFGSNDSTIEDAVPLSHTGSTHDTDMRHDLAVITDFYILIDVCKRMDGYVRS